MFLAARGLREREDLTTARVAGEWLVVLQSQARKVWLQTALATAVVTAAAVALALLRRQAL